MKSMTGFGFGEHRDEKRHLAMTLKSYNNRFLDLFIYLPPSLAVLEPEVRRFLAERVLRGRVELYVKATELQEAPRVYLDRSAVRTYVAGHPRPGAGSGAARTVALEPPAGTGGDPAQRGGRRPAGALAGAGRAAGPDLPRV